MSPRDESQPQPHDQRPDRQVEGLRPLLQGHLRSKKHGRGPASLPKTEHLAPEPVPPDEPGTPEPKGQVTQGKETADRRRRREGSDQGLA